MRFCVLFVIYGGMLYGLVLCCCLRLGVFVCDVKCVCVCLFVIYCVLLSGLCVFCLSGVFVCVCLCLCVSWFKNVFVCFVCGLLNDVAWFVFFSCCLVCPRVCL